MRFAEDVKMVKEEQEVKRKGRINGGRSETG